jgi:Skp family chaperone for outer membrane proteins
MNNWEENMLKKWVFTLILTTFIFTFFSCSGESGDSRNRGRMSPEQRAAQLKEALDLNSDQTKQIEQIFIESQEKMAKLREDSQGDRSQMRELMRESREEVDKRMGEVLTEEQKAKYQEYQQDREERRRSRRGD